MSDHDGAESLSSTRHMVLILRLVLAPGKRQLQGDVVDPETGWSLSFKGVGGIGRAVERLLAAARHRAPPGDDGGETADDRSN